MKTIQELEKMTDDELRILLAETQGYHWDRDDESGRLVLNHRHPCKGWTACERPALNLLDSPDLYDVPNYPADLNACHAVILGLSDAQQAEYGKRLYWLPEVGIAESGRADEMSYAMLAKCSAVKPRRVTITLILTLKA